MSAATYVLHPSDWVLGGSTTDLLLHDLPKDKEELHIQALVASGDYFEMLATVLEQVARALPLYSTEQYLVHHYVQQLLHLQRYYKIIKRH